MSNLPENTEYTGAVGALVTCKIDNKKYVILQKRPLKKPDSSPESFPNALDPTIRGGLEPIDRNDGIRGSIIRGLMRETAEEINEMLLRSSYRSLPNYAQQSIKEDNVLRNLPTSSGNLIKLDSILNISRKVQRPKVNEGETVRKTNVTFGFSVTRKGQENDHLIPAIQQLASEHILVLLSADEIDKLVPLDPKLHKKDGITEEGKYGMFADEIEAVKKALSE